MSPNALLAESGYLNHRGEITIKKMRAHFAANPDLIGNWVRFSEDKRVDRGWYFLADSAGGPYLVGYLPDNPSRPEEEFVAAAFACATYVKRELESLAS